MVKTTLCYIEKDDCYLMLYRNKKHNDPNAGKWVGVGGKFEEGENADECLVREVREELGVRLTEFKFRGLIHFMSDIWDDEDMYLYSGYSYEGIINEDCNEGELAWIKIDDVMSLNLWEGDRCFLELLTEEASCFEMTLKYEGDNLISCESELMYEDK